MRVSVSPDTELKNASLIVPQGHLDAGGIDDFWERASEPIGQNRPYLMLDMSAVDYVSSAGVGVLIRLLTRAQQNKGGLAMFGCNSRILAIIRVIAIESVLNVRDSIEDARAKLKELGAA